MNDALTPESAGRARPVTREAAAEGRRPRRARNSLSRSEIVAAARRLTEVDGLAALSMPALARELACAPASIYRHFTGKEELVGVLADQVMRDMHLRLPPAGDGPWRDELVAYFTAYRSLMNESTAYREVMLFAPVAVLRAALTPAQMRRVDSGIGLLCRAGLSLADATRAYNVCFNYTRSFTALEHAARQPVDGSLPPSAVPSLPAAEYPHLAELPDATAALAVDEAGFRFGLQLLAEGITRTVEPPRGDGAAAS
ncbi:TetR/AcrR family transcriptional regulator [Frankia sp. Ag45/Mut15]|uniref:TetR/AcrR family transcriptional regulator n=1 Tax=Frankia umida TaxID=573489 RepID=A0ABT0K2H0_9ACTN|nr:TetR/AcrR family transcriptional regulator [Frankia umida]MCK9877911.1 TetR/AcrR family transcriptional regulator [Frankia umida]